MLLNTMDFLLKMIDCSSMGFRNLTLTELRNCRLGILRFRWTISRTFVIIFAFQLILLK